jgi:hypothetical protein
MIRYLIELICTIYLIRLAFRWLFSLLFTSTANNVNQQYYKQQQQTQQKRPREGSITIDHVPPAKKSSVPDSEGDFVDYEEIK